MTNHLTDEEIQLLPTIEEVIGSFATLTLQFDCNGGWTNHSALSHFPIDAAWDLPNAEFLNDADDEQFIAVRTQMKRVSLKPNLKYRPFLFRGEKKDHGKIISSFSQENLTEDKKLLKQEEAREKHLIANLKAEDFMALLKTHPLFMMLDRGIFLEPVRKPIFINMNYYGLAQHYNFRTALIDFSPEIEVAAFFATTINKGDDVYEPVTDTVKYPYGVIYVHQIEPYLSFKGIGFTTIGLQLYPRTGAQRGFCFNEGMTPFDVNKLVKPIYFRQDAEASKRIFNLMNEGKALFPDDSISKYAKMIADSNEISGETFARNLYSNQDNLEENLDVLTRHHMKVNWHKMCHFDNDMLKELDQDLKNGLWEQFCRQIYFADSEKGEQMSESLLNLPKNPAYRHYFTISDYERITAYEADMHRRAARILKN